MRRSSALIAVATFAAAALLTPRGSAGDAPAANQQALPSAFKWDLERLNKEPFKLIKAASDEPKGLVQFVIEFTRTPKPSELFAWEQLGGMVQFRFLDEDGIVLSKVVPRLQGELIPKQGARIRLIIKMPEERTLALIRSVKAE